MLKQPATGKLMRTLLPMTMAAAALVLAIYLAFSPAQAQSGPPVAEVVAARSASSLIPVKDLPGQRRENNQRLKPGGVGMHAHPSHPLRRRLVAIGILLVMLTVLAALLQRTAAA